MRKIIRVKYTVNTKNSEWSEKKLTELENPLGKIEYKDKGRKRKTTSTFLESLKIQPSENLQDKNINRKDFNLSFFIECFKEDKKQAKQKLKQKTILLLHKHQKKLDKMLGNL